MDIKKAKVAYIDSPHFKKGEIDEVATKIGRTIIVIVGQALLKEDEDADISDENPHLQNIRSTVDQVVRD